MATVTIPPRLYGWAPPWTWAVLAMVSIQTGSAVAVSLFALVGPAGTAWMRLSFGALILILMVRPQWSAVRARHVPALLGLGVATGVMTTAFLTALQTLPLGTAVAIEFLGPLTVAAITGRSLRAGLWPLLALGGVVLMTQPWAGGVEIVGIGFALLAAMGWGSYIWFSQKVGDSFSGVQGLAMSLPVAALVASVFGAPQAWGNISWVVIIAALGITLLTPVIPFSLEMLALKQMNKRAFGTLMASGPAIALVMGLIFLAQVPNALEILGIALVIVAGVATQRSGGRADFARPASPRIAVRRKSGGGEE